MMNPKEIVRTGYDSVSHAYRGDQLDWNDPGTIQYSQWIDELGALLPARGPLLDLGCGNGIPAARLLVNAGFTLTGVDISPVQIARATRIMPDANLICADFMELAFPAQAFAAIVSFYAIIHVPLAEQPILLHVWMVTTWRLPDGNRRG